MLTISILLHSVTSLFGLYLFVLFVWWWIKQGSATKIYNYTTGLMFGIFIQHLGAVNTYITHYEIYGDVEDFQYWPLRQIFMLAPLALYAKHATRKIINEYKAKKQLAYENERRKLVRRATNGDSANKKIAD